MISKCNAMLKYCNRYTPSILYQTLKPIDLRDSGASEEFLGNGHYEENG